MLAKAKARIALLASLVSITLLTASGQPRRDVGGSAVRGGNRLGNDPDAGVVLPPSTLRRRRLIIVLMGTGVYRTIEAHAYVGKHLKRQCVAIGEKTWT